MSNSHPDTDPTGVESNDQVLIGAGGCLTSAGFEAVLRAAPGETPRDLADHLSACELCQTRLLAGHDHGGVRVKRQPPPIWRSIVVLFVILLALSTFAYLAYWITGG
ncbi:MAG: hypothetical protein JXO72_02765 [Vicinamibacteria bacterium]|nr:hypothetical protein [Vicinamibacteria bacterium]